MNGMTEMTRITVMTTVTGMTKMNGSNFACGVRGGVRWAGANWKSVSSP